MNDYLSKESRNNHKTMRISDTALEFIMTFEGTTFNDKVNNMIEYFIHSKEKQEEEIRMLDEKIRNKKRLINTIQSKAYELLNNVNEIENTLKNLK